MEKKVLICIGVVIVVVILGLLIFSGGDGEKIVREEKFEGEELEVEGSKALQRTVDAWNNYQFPDSYKLEFITKINTYSKIGDREQSSVIDIELLGYVDSKNKRYSIENKFYDNEEGEQVSKFIYKDGKQYTIQNGEVIDIQNQEWGYQDELRELVYFLNKLEEGEEPLEYSVIKESGNTYDVLRIEPTLDYLSGIDVGSLGIQGIDYESYTETWLNRKTDQIERANFYFNFDIDTPFETRNKVEIKVIRTEINERIPDSVFDVPN